MVWYQMAMLWYFDMHDVERLPYSCTMPFPFIFLCTIVFQLFQIRYIHVHQYVPLCLSLQKWQCVEDATGKLRLSKCKGMASLSAVQKPSVSSIKSQIYLKSLNADVSVNSEPQGCNCEPTSYRLSTFSKNKLLAKKSEYNQTLSNKLTQQQVLKNHSGCTLN